MKIYIDTLGCPKNHNDSAKVKALLQEEGHTLEETPENSNAILVNTCGFINDAKVESIDRIFEMASLKPEILMVSGCLSQRYGDELFREMPEVNIFLGVNNYNNLNEILKNHKLGERELHIEKAYKDIDTIKRKIERTGFSATLKISEGCNNSCAYCIIPQIRGKYRSRTMEDIEEEARFLISKGIKEVILIGQDVTAYGMDIYGGLVLHKLIERLCKIEGLKWLRLMYCYDDRITEELVDTMAREEKVCKYIDMPIQHSSDNILREMGRRGGRESIESAYNLLRTKIPEIVIRTTLIVGFPGETEEDFENLLDFVCEKKFNRLGVFSYSQEEGTRAALMENQVDEEIKEIRKDSIMRNQMDISLEKNKESIGKVIEAVIEEIDEDSYVGRTIFDAPEIDNGLIISNKDKENKYNIGDIVRVKIIDAFDYDLVGEIVE